jgi:hypothetical protein
MFCFFRSARHGLVERQVDLVRLVYELGGFIDRQVQLSMTVAGL